MTPGFNAPASARLSAKIRRLIRKHPPVEAAAALTYELAAILGENAASVESVDHAIDLAVRGMKLQVRHFGIGKVHP